jgi:hypothetical protein
VPAGTLTLPNFSALSVLKVVASSAPVRHSRPSYGSMSLPGVRPLSEGRPYSIERLLPSMVHSLRTCGLPALPGWTVVVFCASSDAPNSAAAAMATAKTDRFVSCYPSQRPGWPGVCQSTIVAALHGHSNLGFFEVFPRFSQSIESMDRR